MKAISFQIILYHHPFQYSTERSNRNAVICYGNTLRFGLAHTRENRAATKHTRPAMNYNIVVRKVIGEIITAHNIYLQAIAQLAAQQAWQFHAPYVLVLRNVAARLGNEHSRGRRQGKQSLCATAEGINVTFMSRHKHRERCQTGLRRRELFYRGKDL